jgi:hypothetical protein
MSERMTEVQPAGALGYALRGHVGRVEAIEQARRHYRAQLEGAQQALRSIDRGMVAVYHQRGVIVARDRRPVRS